MDDWKQFEEEIRREGCDVTTDAVDRRFGRTVAYIYLPGVAPRRRLRVRESIIELQWHHAIEWRTVRTWPRSELNKAVRQYVLEMWEQKRRM